MYQQTNGRVRVEPTHAVYSNIVQGERKTGRRKTTRPVSIVRSKTPKGALVRIPRRISVRTPRRALSRPKTAKEPKMNMASSARLEAAKTVMGQFFPSVYRNVTASGENTNAPVTSITVTDRYSVVPNNGLAMIDVSPTMAEHIRFSTTIVANAVTAETVSDTAAMTSFTANCQYYRCAGMEVVVEPNTGSSAIQGEWAMYCFQGVNTIVGQNINDVLTNPQAARGFFTDAHPSCRYVWFKKDELDDDWWPVGYLPGNGETSLRMVLNANASPTLIVYVTTTWTMQPNAAGQFVIPGQPAIVDQAAYQRGLKVFGDAVNENIEVITNPRVANQKHPGILAQVAEAVSDTVGEASLLKKALGGAWSLGKSLVGAVTSLFSSSKENAALITTMVRPSWVRQLEKELDESKDTTIPDDVLGALKTLARYDVHRGKRGELMVFECNEEMSAPTVVLPLTRNTSRAAR